MSVLRAVLIAGPAFATHVRQGQKRTLHTGKTRWHALALDGKLDELHPHHGLPLC